MSLPFSVPLFSVLSVPSVVNPFFFRPVPKGEESGTGTGMGKGYGYGNEESRSGKITP